MQSSAYICIHLETLKGHSWCISLPNILQSLLVYPEAFKCQTSYNLPQRPSTGRHPGVEVSQVGPQNAPAGSFQHWSQRSSQTVYGYSIFNIINQEEADKVSKYKQCRSIQVSFSFLNKWYRMTQKPNWSRGECCG